MQHFAYQISTKLKWENSHWFLQQKSYVFILHEQINMTNLIFFNSGIESRLDYLVDLGVETIWFSPIYESPMKDFGYDISNFTNVDSTFGSLADFQRMSERAHQLGIKNFTWDHFALDHFA